MVVNKDKAGSDIAVTGSQYGLMSPEQREVFDMSDLQLMHKVNDYFGHMPIHGVYINDPSNGNMYDKYGWEPVKVLLKPVSAYVDQVHSIPKVLRTQTFINNSTEDAVKFHAAITHTVSDSFDSTFSKSKASTRGQEISYGIKGIGGDGGSGGHFGGKTSFSFTTVFGEAYSTSHMSKIGSMSGFEVTVKPLSSKIAELSSYQGTLTAKVTYEASLSGRIAANYNPTVSDPSNPLKGKHHYWNFDVNAIMGNHRLSLVLPPPTHLNAHLSTRRVADEDNRGVHYGPFLHRWHYQRQGRGN